MCIGCGSSDRVITASHAIRRWLVWLGPRTHLRVLGSQWKLILFKELSVLRQEGKSKNEQLEKIAACGCTTYQALPVVAENSAPVHLADRPEPTQVHRPEEYRPRDQYHPTSWGALGSAFAGTLLISMTRVSPNPVSTSWIRLEKQFPSIGCCIDHWKAMLFIKLPSCHCGGSSVTWVWWPRMGMAASGGRRMNQGHPEQQKKPVTVAQL
ncbi:hypothetical protein FB45DRAFT_1003426 [Roridomyces roridus]|uniref:Uncharacterized protein n=1 Tax=Roridomyces roridus TaxID=1738132 RepID=A0AAD7BTD2_9AGAR|nr:hypothetical protein FB45DRAFT_1003426 [Roridomyces roridus]